MSENIEATNSAPQWEELGLVVLASGETLTLSRKGDEYSVGVDGLVLMNSRSHYSEEQLAVLGCAHLEAQPDARVLVGGLGMGFTLRAALDALPATARVDIGELLPEIVAWNQGCMGHLAGEPLSDPRAIILLGDIQRTLAASSDATYDAILLDIDNGPVAFTSVSNQELYSDDGLRLLARTLKASGVLALWSTGDDGNFTRRLRDNGFHVRKKRVPARKKGCAMHLLWIATKT
jgi:spermidine synthase